MLKTELLNEIHERRTEKKEFGSGKTAAKLLNAAQFVTPCINNVD